MPYHDPEQRKEYDRRRKVKERETQRELNRIMYQSRLESLPEPDTVPRPGRTDQNSPTRSNLSYPSYPKKRGFFPEVADRGLLRAQKHVKLDTDSRTRDEAFHARIDWVQEDVMDQQRRIDELEERVMLMEESMKTMASLLKGASHAIAENMPVWEVEDGKRPSGAHLSSGSS